MTRRKKMRFHFDFEKSKEEIARLKREVAEISVKDIEDAEMRTQSVWEDAFAQILWNLHVRVGMAGMVPADKKRCDDKEKNPDVRAIGTKLARLIEDLDKDCKKVKRIATILRASRHFPLIRKKEEWLERLKDCFA